MNKCFCFALTLVLIVASGKVKAQTTSKVEVGAQFTSLTVPPSVYYNSNEAGFGGRLTFNIDDHIGLEGEANFFPDKNVFNGVGQGRALQAQFGVKAGRRYERFGAFAKVRPGFLTVGDAVSLRPGSSINTSGFTTPLVRVGRETHFTTDLGGVVEFYPSKRTLVRFEGGDTILRFGPHYDFAPTSGQLVKQSSRITHNLQITAGVGFRLGSPPDSNLPPTSNGPAGYVPRFEVDIHFTSMTRNAPAFACPEICFSDDTGPTTEPGLGGRFTYNVNPNLGLEAELNFFPRITPGTPAGHIFQGQFGVKAGKRFSTFGVFAKFRPGFVGFTQTSQLIGTHTITFAGRQLIAGDFRFGRDEYFSMDAGGVLEWYVSRRIVTRMDFGDTIIKYGEYAVQGFSTANLIVRRPPETRHNFQFTTGAGFRF